MINAKKLCSGISLAYLVSVSLLPSQSFADKMTSVRISDGKTFQGKSPTLQGKPEKLQGRSSKLLKKDNTKFDDFFSFGGSYVSDLYSQSVDAKLNRIESDITNSDILKNLIGRLFKAEMTIGQDLYSINAAPGTNALDNKGSKTTGVNATIEIDLGQNILGIPAYFLGVKSSKAKELTNNSKLYSEIADAMFKYLQSKKLVALAEAGLAKFGEHLEGAKARFKTGVISEITLKGAEYNYSQMQAKYSEALIRLQNAKQVLFTYSNTFDLSEIDKCNFSFENLDLEKYISEGIETLFVKKAKADLQYVRATSIANTVSSITPTIRITASDLYGKSDKIQDGKKIYALKDNPAIPYLNAAGAPRNLRSDDLVSIPDPSRGSSATIKASLVFDLSPSNLFNFGRAELANKQAALKLLKAKRESDTNIERTLAEYKLQQDAVRTYKTATELKRVIAKLTKQRDIRDAVSYYEQLLKADQEYYKASEEEQKQIQKLFEIGVKLLELVGVLIPSDHKKATAPVVSDSRSNMKSINAEANSIMKDGRINLSSTKQKKSVLVTKSKLKK